MPDSGPVVLANWLGHIEGRPSKEAYGFPLWSDVRVTGTMLEGLGPRYSRRLRTRRSRSHVTSPTGVQEVNALDGTCLEARILDGIEAQLDGKAG